jgi:hypothetical protein
VHTTTTKKECCKINKIIHIFYKFTYLCQIELTKNSQTDSLFLIFHGDSYKLSNFFNGETSSPNNYGGGWVVVVGGGGGWWQLIAYENG